MIVFLRKLAFAGLACVFASVAVADCPVRADLASGVVLVRGDNLVVSVFQVVDGTLTELREVRVGDEVVSTRTRYAHPLAASELDWGGDATRLLYDGDIGLLERLNVVEHAEYGVALWLGEEQQATGRFTADLTGTGQVRIGDCRYPVWKVETVLTFGGQEVDRVRVDYAPALGLVLRARRAGGAGFRFTWIGTVDEFDG